MKRFNGLIYLLVIIKFLLPFFLADPFYQPHRDEYLYLAEGHHLAWGFMEVPPLMSVLAAISNFMGAGMFWIKFWPALAGSLTFLLVAKMVRSLGGGYFAIILAFLPFLFTGYIRLFYFFHPNFLDAFFWTLIAFSLLRYLQSLNNKWLYLFGLATGLGMMSKYSVAFYACSILLAFLLSRQRKIFLHKHLYLSVLLAFLIFLPNLLWQYQHRFPVLKHMAELQQEQLQFIDPIKFLISQLVIFLPCAFIWIFGLYYAGISRQGQKLRPFALAYIIVIVLLLLLHGKDYYTVGAYPVLFAIGASYLEKLTALRHRFWRYIMVLIPVCLGILIFPILMPIAKPKKLARYYESGKIEKSGALRWEDQKNHALPQDFADMIEWRETSEKAALVYKGLAPEERTRTMVYCRAYYFAGALNYYGPRVGLPEVYSDNASFLFWMPKQYNIRNLILVAHQIPDKDDLVFQQFERMTVMDSISNPLARENGIKIILYQNGNEKVNEMIAQSVMEQESKFTR
jgi:hypothetical protein